MRVKCLAEEHNTPFLQGPEKVFAPGKPWQNLKPYDYRAVLFTYSHYEERLSSYKKVSGVCTLCF